MSRDNMTSQFITCLLEAQVATGAELRGAASHDCTSFHMKSRRGRRSQLTGPIRQREMCPHHGARTVLIRVLS